MDPRILNIIFPRPLLERDPLYKYKEGIILIPTESEKIPCYFQKNPESNDILIIFHGNGSDMMELPDVASEISSKYKINILVPEYPGYSIYNSKRSHEKCLENSLIIYDFVLNNMKNITEKNIYILGRSLGSSVAIYLSSKRNPAGTFLISAFTDFSKVGDRDEEDKKILAKTFRSIDYVDKIKSPVLFIHGKCDFLVDYEESVKLFDKCDKNIKKEIVLKEDMEHNFFLDYLNDEIIPCIADFAKRNCSWNNEIKEGNSINMIELDKKFYITDEEINNILKERNK